MEVFRIASLPCICTSIRVIRGVDRKFPRQFCNNVLLDLSIDLHSRCPISSGGMQQALQAGSKSVRQHTYGKHLFHVLSAMKAME
jgi:hypothetical protein